MAVRRLCLFVTLNSCCCCLPLAHLRLHPSGAFWHDQNSNKGVVKELSCPFLQSCSFVSFLFSFLVFLRYQIYYGYPLQTYLEYPIIIAQDVILLLFILSFSGNTKRALFYAVTFGGGWYVLTLRKWIIDLAMNLCTLISAASKLAQLRCLWQTKDSGQVSALTWSMSAYTCATRIVTTVMTTNDLAVLIRFITMLILNIWVTATILHYRKTKKTD
ncbi:PREDICTED: PQ-loop repeat-containing protein 3 [Leptosomus discolor]|uniref:PQ-loop repeat-containing protein 3 n=1 Tax=Leptosomus discolor TaxID=188344 RepID=UPI000522AF72|nr:PREDICTED: PQ-loop repeat-containing protein 3 [Leptosomus discolor]